MTIGILGLQGCCEPHLRKFAELGASARRIIYPGELKEITGLVIPGGETTTMLKALTAGLWEELLSFGEHRPIWGICAGCILLAKHVFDPEQPSLGLLDIDVTRNAYGAQNESFVAPLQVRLESKFEAEGVFIRAPKISRLGAGIEVLARHEGEPVMVQGGRLLATTFHPELTDCTEFHRHFLHQLETAANN